jgi:hypothetical protein
MARPARFLPKLVIIVWITSVGTVIYLSLIPGITLSIQFWNADKFQHLIAYLWLGILPLLGFTITRHALWAVVSVLLLGIALEAAQILISGRMFSPIDMFANLAGTLGGMYLGHRLRRPFLSTAGSR